MKTRCSKTQLNCLILLTALLSFVSTHSIAKVTASVSMNQVAKGEVFRLKIISDERLDSDEIDFSALDEDFFIGQPNFGSSLNFINGKKSVRSEWNLSLAPLRSGILTIPRFSVGSDITESIQITATVDPSAPNQEDLIEYQTQLSRDEIYPGEIARLDTRLIVKTDPRQLQNPSLKPPTYSGGLDIEPIGESKQYQTVIDGLEVTIVDQAYQIIARESGQFVISGPKITATILDRNSRTGATKIIPIDTQRKEIHVNVLAKPSNFKGNWLPSPNLKLEQTWQDDKGVTIEDEANIEIQVGAPLTRILTLTVEGIAQSHLPNIKVLYPNAIRLYEESPQFSQTNNSVIMTVKQVLIPKDPGNITLPPVNISWWNTREKRSETATVNGLSLAIKKSDSQALTITSNQITENNKSDISVEKVIVKDAGYWPYLTAIFALLWIITATLLLRRPKRNEQPQKNQGSNTIKPLLTAIQNNDGIQAQALFDRWVEENYDADKLLIREIKLELTQMMKSIYQPSKQSWNNTHLTSLVKRANNTKLNKPSEPPLASL